MCCMSAPKMHCANSSGTLVWCEPGLAVSFSIARPTPSAGVSSFYRAGFSSADGLLKKRGFSLRVNHKKLSGNSHPDRDAQFSQITELRERCAAKCLPIISVDTKNKELVGTFKNQGAKWDREPVLVNDHDFRSDADSLPTAFALNSFMTCPPQLWL